MFKLSHVYSEDMALALIIWFCALPLAAVVVAPVFGTRVALLAALILLIVIMVVCWGLCGWKLVRKGKENHEH